jgi:hypothetical protein
MQTNPSNYFHVSNLYIYFGLIHRQKGDQDKSIELFRQANDENHASMAYVIITSRLFINNKRNFLEH